jgi:hypothetical protein
MTRVYSMDLPREGNGPYQVLRGFQDGLVKRFVAALSDPRAAQQARLEVLLEQVRGTAFAGDHDLSRVRTLDDWRAAVPVRTHAELSPYLRRVAYGEPRVLTQAPVQCLLETSGTTGAPKHLPCTAPWAASVRDAQKLWMLALLRDHEGVARGRALTIVSAAEHAQSPGGLPIGSNTGRMHRAQPWYVRWRFPVPYAVFLIDDPRLRQYAILRYALQSDLSTITTANPSTLLLLCRRLQEWRAPLSADLAAGTLAHGPAEALDPAVRRRLWWSLRRRRVPDDWRPIALWPHLTTLNCWRGGSAGYFVERLPDAMGGELPVREVGITASEGYFAVPMGPDWGGGVLWTLGHVLEFIGDDGAPRWAWELEPGEQVRLVFSTEAGLYRYDLQDTLEVVGRCEETPVVRFVGKSGRFLNATGEKVTEDQVAEAMRRAARATGLHPVGFTARTRMAEVPTVELAVEGVEGAQAERLAEAFDAALRGVNLEYDSKRSSDRLGAAAVRRVGPGTYARFRAARVAAGAPEGQVKDPIVAVNDTEWGRLRAAAQEPA